MVSKARISFSVSPFSSSIEFDRGDFLTKVDKGKQVVDDNDTVALLQAHGGLEDSGKAFQLGLKHHVVSNDCEFLI